MKTIYIIGILAISLNSVLAQTEPDLKLELSNTDNNYSGETLDIIDLSVSTTTNTILPNTGARINFYTQQASNNPIKWSSIYFQRALRDGKTQNWDADGHIKFNVRKYESGVTSYEDVLTINGDGITLGDGMGFQVSCSTCSFPWPDFVFESDYDLLPLGELQSYIKKNKHLPEVPSAKEVEKDGIDLVEMNRILLKKVEELTLYLIDQNEQLEKQSELIDQLINAQK